MKLTDEEVAARCLEDAGYAREVLNGDEHARVREAILADWKQAPEVQGYFNPQPDPPGFQADLQRVPINEFQSMWPGLPKLNLSALAGKS